MNVVGNVNWFMVAFAAALLATLTWLREYSLKPRMFKMLLFPDMRREQYEGNDNFVFAAPCTEDEWNYLHGKSEQTDHYLPYIFMREFYHESAPPDVTCIILRQPNVTDEQAVTTAAWIRVSEEYTGMIYAVSYESVPTVQSLSSIVARTAGCNPKQVKHIEIKRSNV